MILEQGVPLPSEITFGRKCIEIMKKMDVGDSFLIPNSTSNFRSSLQYAAKKTGIKFKTKRWSNTEIRVWCTAKIDLPVMDIQNHYSLEYAADASVLAGYKRFHKLSLRKLAQLLNVSTTSVHRWLTNMDRCPQYIVDRIRALEDNVPM